MALLEQIQQMKKEGRTEDEIKNNLQEQGVSPRAINDAFNQSKIKDAVAGQEDSSDGYYVPTPSSQGKYQPGAIEMGEQDNYYQPQQEMQYPPQNYAPQTQEYYPQEGYENYSAGASNTDFMIEVAEQVFHEKIRKIQKQVEEMVEFAGLAQGKIKDYSERIKRIENIIDKLQVNILEKVGSYGENLNSVKKEMAMMQDSFSKVLPELAKKHAHKK